MLRYARAATRRFNNFYGAGYLPRNMAALNSESTLKMAKSCMNLNPELGLHLRSDPHCPA